MSKECKSNVERGAKKLAAYAQQAVLYEAVLTPKPGLVDACNTGSHNDMNIFSFVDSSVSLSEGFYRFAEIGLTWKDSPLELFAAIRPIGMEVEQEMFTETMNINTHKGVIFSLGIFLAATGKVLQKRFVDKGIFSVAKPEEIDEIFSYVKEMTFGLVSNDFKNLHLKKKITNGERLFLNYGFTGIRGEAEAGYPLLQKDCLPFLRQRSSTSNVQFLLLEVLFLLMSKSEDSNLVHRGGIEALFFVQNSAKKIFQEYKMFTYETLTEIENLNRRFIEKNLSPGGSADLLILAIYLGKVENLL